MTKDVMEVYRIEHTKKGCGPWCTSMLGWDDAFMDAVGEAGRELPCPEEDGIPEYWEITNPRFAFPNPELITYFFDAYALEMLEARGFVVRVYKIGDRHLQGEHQIVFDVTDAEIISEILLSDLRG
jgi:hypothetical protein